MSLLKYTIDDNWNIGFANLTSEELVKTKRLNKVQWLKHNFRDRFFADPFILKITDNTIVVFVEECEFEHPKGRIVELVIDKTTKHLLNRYVLLELDTHLSYPAIIRKNGKVYVYPENGQSGKLNLYLYNEEEHILIQPKVILNEAVADSTIYEQNGQYFLFATKYPKTQEQVFLFVSESFDGPYNQVSDGPFTKARHCSRPAGNLFFTNQQIYRPTQDCSSHYGSAISMMNIKEINDTVKEKMDFVLTPVSFKYSRGIHTINFYNNICIVDGCGYLYQILGRLFHFMKILKCKIK